MQAWSQNWDGFNERAREPSQTAEVQQSRIAYLEQVLSKLQERLQQQQSEWESLSSTPTDATTSPLAKKIEQADLAMVEREAGLVELKEDLAGSHAAIEQARRQQDDVRSAIQEARGHMASLTALQEAASDDRERASLSDWIETESLHSDGTVYASLEVEAGWEGAIEQVLGEALSAQLLSEVDVRGLPGVEALPSGAFVVDNTIESPAEVLGTLAAHVKGPARVMSWLQAVLVAEDLDAAQRLCRDLTAGQSVVTPRRTLARAWMASPPIGRGYCRRDDRAAGAGR